MHAAGWDRCCRLPVTLGVAIMRDVPPLQVTWSLGATVGGSSGSPLIDNSTDKVVGVLTGGYSACYNGLPDYYGRLSAVGSSPAAQAIATL